MDRATIQGLIINLPYEECRRYLMYGCETRTFDLVDDRGIESLKVVSLE